MAAAAATAKGQPATAATAADAVAAVAPPATHKWLVSCEKGHCNWPTAGIWVSPWALHTIKVYSFHSGI